MATMSRRLANAIYFAPYDKTTGLDYAMDLTPLIENSKFDIQECIQDFTNYFTDDVKSLIESVG